MPKEGWWKKNKKRGSNGIYLRRGGSYEMRVKTLTMIGALIVGLMGFGGCAWQGIAATKVEVESFTPQPFEQPPGEAVIPSATASSTPEPPSREVIVQVTAGATATHTATPALIYITKEEIREGTAWLEIPKIRVNTLIEIAEVVYTATGLSFNRPRENPLWVPDWSSEIGLPGLALIYGHRQWGPVPKVFTDLDDLEPGDKAIVKSTQDWLTYKVVETMVVDPEEVWRIVLERDQQATGDGKSQLMLLTCTPWGTDWQRLVVFLMLEEVIDVSESRSGYTSVE